MDYTTRLYDSEPYLTEAEACVTQSLSFGEGFAIILDRSCFFPGGGGQDGDTGTLDGQQVRKVFEKEGVIHHVVDQPISEGKRVMITIDGHKRRRDIEIHTGEHILSGMALSLLGVKNVGFHMGREFATADFDRVLTEEEVDRLELAVNEKIRENTPVLVEYPNAGELETMPLRKRPETSEALRVVTVVGADVCACCGTHGKRSGEVGILKILSAEKFRGGTRIAFLCGKEAMKLIQAEHRALSQTAKLYSTKNEKVPELAAAQKEEVKNMKQTLSGLNRELARLVTAKLAPPNKGEITGYALPYGGEVLREVASKLTQEEGVAVLLIGTDAYVIAKHPKAEIDLGTKNEEMKAQGAVGGGRKDFYFGKLPKERNGI